MRERDEAKREKGEAERERDEAARERVKAMRERDAAMREMDAAVHEKDEAKGSKGVWALKAQEQTNRTMELERLLVDQRLEVAVLKAKL